MARHMYIYRCIYSVYNIHMYIYICVYTCVYIYMYNTCIYIYIYVYLFLLNYIISSTSVDPGHAGFILLEPFAAVAWGPRSGCMHSFWVHLPARFRPSMAGYTSPPRSAENLQFRMSESLRAQCLSAREARARCI